MKFFEDFTGQAVKNGKLVCGDSYLCDRTLDRTEFVLCDGIGSGVYANVAAISCASRLLELFRTGVSQELACEMVADSMHRARKEAMPFSAFSAARILPNGQFTVYSYEAPAPIYIKDGTAAVLKPHFHSAGSEVIGESSGTLDIGDCLVLCSDGVTQAGLGKGYTFGIGAEGIADYINLCLQKGVGVNALPGKIIGVAELLSGRRHEDDATVAVLSCREAQEVLMLTGPPSQKSKDRAFVERFISRPCTHVVCGSTTAEILGRELKREVLLKSPGNSFGSPPEYMMDGIDVITEGAVILNQIYNILGENPERFVSDSPVERLCALLVKADAVTFMVGRAVNTAHTELLFKQLGIRPREATIRLIAGQLRAMGKLVVEEYY
ncbi:Stage II sporulation protein E (SpoIIE) [Sporobacter termitidis DSM 10068]|uniref:Stage II sporulation protein E (SpoIIE) n=1 Tax=Sporobacter termitidis DSM 10068 TaxID=1123282 RepID=A0A1M5YD41_9FIRM|nr:SpoIIE family protein phosphatase [Sporobacter termitidis]SHI09991.1 Stage II sporulation protein E (SpoIIE) [Sporobacter termitidis DSM 10068]